MARDSAVIAAVAIAAAFVTNAVRKDGIPLVQHGDYEILVPCAEAAGIVIEIEPTDALAIDKSSLVLDARSQREFAAWHLPEAVSMPYDYLEATTEAQVRSVAKSRASRVVIYGDGENPDSGRELGRELSSKGIRNVLIIRGGAPALSRALATPTGKDNP